MSVQTFPAFFAEIAPYAKQVAAAYGLRPGLIMALAGEETGYGQDLVGFNLTGIRFVGQPQATGESSGGFAEYGNFEGWAQDMIRVLGLPYYQALRNTAGQSIDAQVAALVASPYNGAGLAARQQWGQLLLEVYQEQGLAAYDASAAPAPAPTPAPSTPTVTGNGSSITIANVAGAGAVAIIAALVAWLAGNA